MADPRYKNGVFTNTARAKKDAQRQQANALEQAHPLCHGWTVAYTHPELKKVVYEQAGYKLMAWNESDWMLQPPGAEDPLILEGYNITEITELIKNGTTTEEIIRRTN
jgi:hypothetical protein